MDSNGWLADLMNLNRWVIDFDSRVKPYWQHFGNISQRHSRKQNPKIMFRHLWRHTRRFYSYVIDRDLRVKYIELVNITKVIKISRIDGCNVKRVDSLEFDFFDGACDTYQFEVEKILFCFGYDQQKCHL